MRTRILCVAIGLIFLTSPVLAASQDPVNDDQKTLYALGLAISQSLGTFALSETELDMVKTGITDGVLKQTPKVDLQTFGPKIQQFQQARLAVAAEGEKKAGAALPQKPRRKKGRRRRSQGSSSPNQAWHRSDTESHGYRQGPLSGTLTDGTVFDSSVKRGEPATFG